MKLVPGWVQLIASFSLLVARLGGAVDGLQRGPQVAVDVERALRVVVHPACARGRTVEAKKEVTI